jgi:Leucine-rich repeat (LRR) protein
MARDKAYFEAEKKIEKALKSGATELDLSNMKLTELPESIGQLILLLKLDIGGDSWKDDKNQLTQLPDSVGQLTRLTELNLSSNQLTTLPESLGQLTQLTVLDLSNNQLTTLVESLGQLTQLTELDLSNNQLTTLPAWLGQFTQMQVLSLSSIHLKTFPPWLSQFRKLRILDLSRNQHITLPESFQSNSWQVLDTLSLMFNSLSTLPNWLGELPNLKNLYIGCNSFTNVPACIGNLKNLQRLRIQGREAKLKNIPKWIGDLRQLIILDFNDNSIETLPAEIQHIQTLQEIDFGNNQLTSIPSFLDQLKELKVIWLYGNNLVDVPPFILHLEHLTTLSLKDNPLNPELAEAYKQGLDDIKAYLGARAEGEVTLNEAKLILVGEGGVGKTSLLAALHGEEWVENRETTYGMEVDVTSLILTDPLTSTEITFNGWDFGGQDIYRHTHQLFFTAPAVYLAVWEPRRGPEQSRVAEWIKIIKHRAYDESRPDLRPRVLVVATHGGPKERLAHIDEQALRDEFGDMIAGFYHVDSKPDENGIFYQLDQLKNAIAREAASISSVGRSVPHSWKKILNAIRKRSAREPYISYSQYEALCSRQGVSKRLANLYTIILNELGYLIHYRNDETLRDTVILKPDYLSKAVSFILDDKATKEANGLIEHRRLGEIWDDPARPVRERYPSKLHPIFLKLMEQFDLSYQVNLPEVEALPTSLMAQLVPSVRSEGWEKDWVLKPGDVERTQVCRISDAQTGRTVEVEGLIYRLIVRLHRYSLGRKNYLQSRHWKTGLILDDGYNGRAFIEDVGGDIYVTVRAAYPERFLFHLCSEVQWLVDNFWKGLNAKLFVPCPTTECKGLLEIDEIMDFKNAGMPKVRCSVCANFHEIDSLMATMRPKPEWQDAVEILRNDHKQILQAADIGFDSLRTQLRVLMSQADEQYEELLRWLSDPAKDGPRLFSFEPLNRSVFDPRAWTKETFRLILWCEHSKLPLPYINGLTSTKGVYEIELTREWFKKAAPVLKVVTGTLSLILPVASSGIKLAVEEAAYKTIEKQLDFGKEIIEASLTGSEKVVEWLGDKDETSIERGLGTRAEGSILRELHAFLAKEDPSFGELVRVTNKRQEFLWVHEKFAGEY